MVTSKSLIEKLNEMEDRPWPTFGKSGKGLTLKKLGDILNEFEIYSTQHWQDGKKIRGYPVAHFASAFCCLSWFGSGRRGRTRINTGRTQLFAKRYGVTSYRFRKLRNRQ